MSNTPLNEFLKLNPGFNLSSTAPQGPHHLLIPVSKAQSFRQNLALLPYDERVDKKRYHAETIAQIRHDQIQTIPSQHKVKAGESLVSIADKNNTTPQSIRQANNLASNSIHSGMMLKMPEAQQSVGTSFNVATAKTKPGSAQVYVVKQGDTIWNIGQKFSVSGKDIADWNKLNSKTALVLGQKLTIKAANQQVIASASKAVFSPAARSISYTVKQGDSLAQISRKFNVSIADLRKWNSPAISNSLTPGKKLKVILNT
ncbi:MAG: LysM peptidoglycan-binding domain-containing protein [Hydrogenophaga sp.]|nr:LysM peptidoglycan-binding domain-containing protein [Hydrogenophaga sp.]